MRHKATLPPIFPVFGPLEATYLGEWGQKLKFKCQLFFSIAAMSKKQDSADKNALNRNPT